MSRDKASSGVLTDDLIARLRLVFTNEVIRAIGALARQQNVCREQAGQAVFVTGMEAAREYIVEQLASAGEAAEALAAASRQQEMHEDLDPRVAGERLPEGQDLPRQSQRGHQAAVAGRLERTLADFERACLVHLEEEQQRVSPDNALIALLCDAVRLKREHIELWRASASPAAPPPWQPNWELEARAQLWGNHGCDEFSALYGDDGEMQCHKCGHDFLREDWVGLMNVSLVNKWKLGRLPLPSPPASAPPLEIPEGYYLAKRHPRTTRPEFYAEDDTSPASAPQPTTTKNDDDQSRVDGGVLTRASSYRSE